MFVKPKFGNLQGRIGSLEDWLKFGDLQKFGKVFVLHVFPFEKKKTTTTKTEAYLSIVTAEKRWKTASQANNKSKKYIIPISHFIFPFHFSDSPLPITAFSNILNIYWE